MQLEGEIMDNVNQTRRNILFLVQLVVRRCERLGWACGQIFPPRDFSRGPRPHPSGND